MWNKITEKLPITEPNQPQSSSHKHISLGHSQVRPILCLAGTVSPHRFNASVTAMVWCCFSFFASLLVLSFWPDFTVSAFLLAQRCRLLGRLYYHQRGQCIGETTEICGLKNHLFMNRKISTTFSLFFSLFFPQNEIHFAKRIKNILLRLATTKNGVPHRWNTLRQPEWMCVCVCVCVCVYARRVFVWMCRTDSIVWAALLLPFIIIIMME